MNEYVLKLNYTKFEMPANIKLETKDFPKARIRTLTPKFKKKSIDFSLMSRPSTPKYIETAENKKRENMIQKRLLANSYRITLKTLSFDKSGHGNYQNPTILIANKLKRKNTVFLTNFHSKYKIKNPTKVLNLPSTSLKLS